MAASAISQDFFYELQIFFYKQCGTHISRVHRLFISSECPFHTLGHMSSLFSSIHQFFMATKVNRSTKSDFFFTNSKNHNKKTDNQKKILEDICPPT